MRASAPLHYPEERLVDVNGNQIQDFALVPMPDLSPSTKLASSNPVLPEERVDYQLVVANIGSATSANVTDTLPGEVTWSGYLTATQGTPVYADGQISWQGILEQGQAITVTYGVSVNQCIPGGTWITNQAEMSGGPGAVFTRTASIVVVNAAPGMPNGLTPANGAVSQPLDITMSWAPSADLNCDPLTYTVAFGTDYPPQVVAVGLTETTYTPGWLAGHTTYYWSVTASDGLSQSSGTVWQFTTLNQAPTMPAAISPPNGSSNVPLTQTLTWESDDPDGDPLTYTLAFGPVTPPPVAATDLTSGVYDPGPLSPGTTYYWYVIASDGMSQTAGITLSFTTEALNYYYYYLPTIQKAPTTPGGSHTSSGWFPPSPVGWLARHK